MKNKKNLALKAAEDRISTTIVDDMNDSERGTGEKNSEKAVIKVSLFCLISNILLSFFKLFAGLIGKSYAMVADSVHSFSDVFTTVIVIIGVKISSKKADKSHPYGHDRFECVTALILSFALFAVGVIIGYNALMNLISGQYNVSEEPKLIALIAAVISILVQGVLFLVSYRVAKKVNSGSLKADAWHHLSDSLSSIGSFIGILGAILGIEILDVVAGFVICLMIVKVSVDIFMDSIKKMTDTSAPIETQLEIENIAKQVDGVKKIDSLRTRLFGNMIYIDIEIACDGKILLDESHEIAQRVHDEIEANMKLVKHCLVHVNPYIKEVEEKKRWIIISFF